MNDSLSFSIVTPSFNASTSIEGTIESVLAQGSLVLEHIVIDGGSTDGTVAILRRYPHLCWVSEADRGQANALNKGFRKASGQIIGWLNADDTYFPDILSTVGELFRQNPDIDLIHGDVQYLDQSGKALFIANGRSLTMPDALLSNPVNQQAAFFRRRVFEQAGYLREDLRYIMDYEFWLRLSRQVKSSYVPELWGTYRLSPGTKTVEKMECFWIEALQVFDELFADPSIPEDVKRARELVYGRMHWLTGVSLYRAGQADMGLHHCRAALGDHHLLANDPQFAYLACRYIMYHSYVPPHHPDWFDALVVDLASDLPAGFIRRARALFYATRADYYAELSDWVPARTDTLHAIYYHPVAWLANRGFLRRSLRAFLGQRATDALVRLVKTH